MPAVRLDPCWSHELLALQSAASTVEGDLKELMQLVVEHALRMVGTASGAMIDIRDLDERECRAASGTTAAYLGHRQPVAGELFRQCTEQRRAQLCVDSQKDDRVDAAFCREADIGSIILAPILYEGAVVGTLKLFGREPHSFGEDELLVAQLLAGTIVTGLAALARDDAYRALEHMGKRFQATFEQAAVGMAHVAIDGHFLLVNDRFCEVLGRSRESLLDSSYQQITHEADLEADVRHVESLLSGRSTAYTIEKRYIRSDGTAIWTNLTVSLVRDERGAPEFFVAVVEDIGRRKAAEERALHDPLTGLPNRRWLIEHFKGEFGRKPARPMVIAYLDLDGFKAVNDQYGHAAGDRCLSDVAACLERSMRAQDSICRIAGDEFVLLMPDIDRARALEIIAHFQAELADLCRHRPWSIGVSAGAVMIDGKNYPHWEDILEAADRLMYEAKRSGDGATIFRYVGETLAAA